MKIRPRFDLLALALVGILFSCKKVKEEWNDIVLKEKTYIKDEIKGTVYLSDPFFDKPDVIAGETTVYLSDTTNSERYLLKTVTDKDGSFTFTHRPDRDDFYLIGQFKDPNGLLFEQAVTFEDFRKDKKITLAPQYPRGKIKITATDAGRQPLFGADIYLFINEEQAKSLGESTVTGYIREAKTNEKGNVFFYDLAVGKYYIAGKKDALLTDSLATISVDLDNQNNYTVGGGSGPIVLSLPPVLAVKVMKTENGTLNPVYNAEVHVFSSHSQAGLIMSDPPPGSINRAFSDKDGIVKFKGLRPGTDYFLNAKATFLDSSSTPKLISLPAPSGPVRLGGQVRELIFP